MPDKKQLNAQRIMDRLDTLATFSSLDDGIARVYLSREHKAAHHQLAQWMTEAGLVIWQDEVGNQWGRLESDNPVLGTLILGSHSDTVINAGKYDGPLGIIMAIEALSQLNGVSLPFHVDVVAFADEEGTRFNSTLLGSSGVCGCWDTAWLNVEDADGISMATAMTEFGLKVEDIPRASRKHDAILAYLEVHIEQGPVLENRDLAVGVVTGIAGARRYVIDVSGTAGHAGTVPIELRQDALCGVAEMIMATESYAATHDVVATVGKCAIKGGAVNVIPGQVQFSLDIRSQNGDTLNQGCDALLTQYQSIAKRRGIQLDAVPVYEASGVLCDARLQQCWGNVVEQVTGQPAYYLLSGAGHDAMMMASVAPVSMLFVRCEKGISHNPREQVSEEDVAVALNCLVAMIQQLAVA